MASRKGMACIAALALLAFVCHAAIGADSDDDRTTTHAITVNAASLPDFDGDGTVGFSDFVIFAQNFGKEVPSDDRARWSRFTRRRMDRTGRTRPIG